MRVLGNPRPPPPGRAGHAGRGRPGTAEVGARHIEPGETGTSSAWMARTLAIAALAVVAVALLLLLKLA